MATSTSEPSRRCRVRLVAADPLATEDALAQGAELLGLRFWHHRAGAPDRLLRGPAEQLLGGTVPGAHTSLAVEMDDRQRRGLEDALQPLARSGERLGHPRGFRRFADHRHQAAVATLASDRRRVNARRHHRAVPPQQARLAAPPRRFDTLRQRSPRLLPSRLRHQQVDGLGAERLGGAPTEKALGSPVPEHDPALAVGGDEGRPDAIEDLPLQLPAKLRAPRAGPSRVDPGIAHDGRSGALGRGRPKRLFIGSILHRAVRRRARPGPLSSSSRLRRISCWPLNESLPARPAPRQSRPTAGRHATVCRAAGACGHGPDGRAP